MIAIGQLNYCFVLVVLLSINDRRCLPNQISITIKSSGCFLECWISQIVGMVSHTTHSVGKETLKRIP